MSKFRLDDEFGVLVNLKESSKPVEVSMRQFHKAEAEVEV